MAIEVKATATEAMVKMVMEEAAQAIMQYKASTEFEDELSDVIYDAFYKGFKECKMKVA